jgi:hypothetical protein
MSVNPGLRAENIQTMNISLPEVKYPTPQQRLTFFKTLMERLQALPGVRSARAVQFLPRRVSILSFRIGVSGFQIQGHLVLPENEELLADYRPVTDGYFNTLGNRAAARAALRRARHAGIETSGDRE